MGAGLSMYHAYREREKKQIKERMRTEWENENFLNAAKAFQLVGQNHRDNKKEIETLQKVVYDQMEQIKKLTEGAAEVKEPEPIEHSGSVEEAQNIVNGTESSSGSGIGTNTSSDVDYGAIFGNSSKGSSGSSGSTSSGDDAQKEAKEKADSWLKGSQLDFSTVYHTPNSEMYNFGKSSGEGQSFDPQKYLQNYMGNAVQEKQQNAQTAGVIYSGMSDTARILANDKLQGWS